MICFILHNKLNVLIKYDVFHVKVGQGQTSTTHTLVEVALEGTWTLFLPLPMSKTNTKIGERPLLLNCSGVGSMSGCGVVGVVWYLGY